MIISLGRIGGADAIGALSQQLGSGDKYRRAFAALALGIAGATSAADTLREGLTGTKDNRVKGAFAIALGLMKDPKAFASVAKIAQGKPDDELLEHCAWYFALSQSLEARAPLEKILGESRAAPAQEAAAIALGVLGMVESQPFLERHLFAERHGCVAGRRGDRARPDARPARHRAAPQGGEGPRAAGAPGRRDFRARFDRATPRSAAVRPRGDRCVLRHPERGDRRRGHARGQPDEDDGGGRQPGREVTAVRRRPLRQM